MKQVVSVAVLILCGCVTINVSLFGERGPLEERVVQDNGADAKIVVVSISGMLHQQQQGLFVTEDTPAYLAEQLRKASEDDDVAGVILRISSPGGFVTASDLMFREVLRFKRRTGKPVVAWITDLGASGAYYLACAADAIIAHPTSVVGSIGVVALFPNVEGLMSKAGIDVQVLKCGALKDAGTPFRKMTKKEQQYFQNLLEGVYERFKAVVAERRGMSADEVARIADGRVFDAEEAKSLKLIDGIGDFDAAVRHLLSLAKIKNANIVVYERPNSYRPTEFSAFSRVSKLLTPGFYYIWSLYIGAK